MTNHRSYDPGKNIILYILECLKSLKKKTVEALLPIMIKIQARHIIHNGLDHK